MYKGKDAVEKLVASLTKGEKRHFTGLYQSPDTKGNQPIFWQFFEILKNGKSQTLNHFYGLPPRTITATKRLLYDNILKSLRALHHDISLDIIIQNQLSEVEILYYHSLADQGLILLRKAHDMASRHEKFGLLLHVLEWEKRLNIVLSSPSRPMEDIVSEEKAVLSKMMQVMKLESIYSNIMVLKKQYGYAKGDLKGMLEQKTVKSKDMPSPESCLSNKARFYVYFIYSVYYWMTFAHRKGYEYSKKLLDFDPHTILPNDFIGGILQHITSSVCLGYFTDTVNGISLGEAYIEEHKLNQSTSFKHLVFTYRATYSLIVYNYMGDVGKLKDAIRYAEAKLSEFENTLPFENKQVVLGNLMNAYMGIGDNDKADALWDSLFNKQSKTIRLDIYNDLYLFRLFSLLHSKTYVLVPSFALSATRYFENFPGHDKVFEVELPIARLFLKERNYTDKEILKTVMKESNGHMQKFISGLKDRNNFQEHYSRYTIWCDAIVNDEPYHVAAKRWYEGYGKQG